MLKTQASELVMNGVYTVFYQTQLTVALMQNMFNMVGVLPIAILGNPNIEICIHCMTWFTNKLLQTMHVL